MYEPLWLKIKNGETDKEIPVRIHSSSVVTLIQAVRKERSMDAGQMRKIGEPAEGPLDIRITDDPSNDEFKIVFFKNRYNERNI